MLTDGSHGDCTFLLIRPFTPPPPHRPSPLYLSASLFLPTDQPGSVDPGQPLVNAIRSDSALIGGEAVRHSGDNKNISLNTSKYMGRGEEKRKREREYKLP